TWRRPFVGGLLREYRLGIVGGVYVQVNRRLPHMRLHPCMLPFEFDGLGGRKRQRIHGRAQNVAASMFVEFASVLEQLYKFWLLVKFILQKNAAGIGQTQPRHN